ncbi:YbjN domain-containing protein [Micrococcales bacterium 31B]|nr:YbjN domain-containing protein [Micrococcales bacterium 31B]
MNEPLTPPEPHRANDHALEALTQKRITHSLDSKGYRYQIDDDGDIGGNWDGRTVFFFQYGEQHEILQVRSCWNHTISLGYSELIQLFCNDWNRERIWPKVYAREEDDSTLGVYAELSTDLEFGVSNEQLDNFIACALGSASQFYTALDKEFAHLAT